MRLSVLTGTVASEQDAKWFEGDHSRKITMSLEFYFDFVMADDSRSKAFWYLITNKDIKIEHDGDIVTLVCETKSAYHLQMALLVQTSQLNHRWT